jgi:RimJ/RimL family protein N-acetyltransferase
MADYLFTSERLGFRGWAEADIAALAAMNSDPEVMEFFPGMQSRAETEAFVVRMQQLLEALKLCYFAVDEMETGEFIGFIGLSEKTFEADFTPCIDIGWRIKRAMWNRGFATEGARRCVGYGFETLRLHRIVSMAPRVNVKSVGIMERIGMQWICDFKHPMLKGDARLEDCVLYGVEGGTVLSY